jgi:hypothetical protein
VETGHRPIRDGAPQAGADDEIGAGSQRNEKFADPFQIVGLVSIGHDHEFTPGGDDPSANGGPVTTSRFPDDRCARCRGEVRGTINGAVVDNDDLARDARSSQPASRLFDCCGDRGRFIEAREHDTNKRGPQCWSRDRGNRRRLVVVRDGRVIGQVHVHRRRNPLPWRVEKVDKWSR